jgi:hypothetical protein
MLRAEISGSADAFYLKLQGRFVAGAAEDTRMLMARSAAGVRLVVDLTEVVFVDGVGEEVLSFFGRLGAEFVAPSSYTLDVCERLHLPLAQTLSSLASSESSPADNDQYRPHTLEKKHS